MSNEKLLEKALFKLFERALPLHEDEFTGEDDYLKKIMSLGHEVKGEVLERKQLSQCSTEYILLYKVTVGESYFYCKLEMDSRTQLATTASLVPKGDVEVDTILQSFVVDEESLLAQCKVYNSFDIYWVILPNLKYNTSEVNLKEVKHYTLKEAINELSDDNFPNPLRDFLNKGTGAPLVPDPNKNYELQEEVSPRIYIGTGVCDQRFSVGNPLQDSWYQVR